MADSKLFDLVDTSSFTTAKQFIDEHNRLESFLDDETIHHIDRYGDEYPVNFVAKTRLVNLRFRVSEIAWQPWARAALIAAGIL